MARFDVDSMLVMDETGFPKPPKLRQILDSDIRELYTRDTTPDKINYITDAIVIYMCGDPKSPARQQGLSDAECLKFALEQAGVRRDYKKDVLVKRLIQRYNEENLTEAGKVVDNLLKAIHNENKVIDKYLVFLNGALECAATIEEARQVAELMTDINKIAKDIPALTSSLKTARENIMYETQEEQTRGGGKFLSSMNADDYNID